MTQPTTPVVDVDVSSLPTGGVEAGQTGRLGRMGIVYKAVKQLVAAVNAVRIVADGAAAAASSAASAAAAAAGQASSALSTAGTAATNAAAALTAATSSPVTKERVPNGELPLTKLAVDVATQVELDDVKAIADAAAAAAGAVPFPPRVLTVSGLLLPTDAGNLVEMRNPAAATVTVPLTTSALAAGAAPFPAGALVGVDRFGSDVTIAPYAPNTSLQRLISPSGLKLRAVGSTATVRTVRRPAGARPAGFWAALSGSQFDTVAHGTVISSLSADAASSVVLPAITPLGAQRPTVHRNASNGRTGIAFNGSTHTLPLSGAWLSLLANRTDAMILVTLLVTGASITGNRTVIAFSVNGGTGPRALMKWRDNGIAGPVVGGRRNDADSSVYCSAVGLTTPDLQVFGGRFAWSASDVFALRNNTQVATNAAFQTDGMTPSTPSTTAAIGSNSTSDGEWFQGTILDIAIGPDDATLRAAYQAWAELHFGEEALVSGDTVS